jgi:hypothetical protein
MNKWLKRTQTGDQAALGPPGLFSFALTRRDHPAMRGIVVFAFSSDGDGS